MVGAGERLGGPGMTVEADEAWVGGLAKNRAFRDTAPKKIIMTLVERGGRARSFPHAKSGARDRAIGGPSRECEA